MEIKFPIGNVTSKKMFKLKTKLDKMGFNCHYDKKGSFWCTYNGELRFKYNDKWKAFAIKNDNEYVIFEIKNLLTDEEVKDMGGENGI